MRVRIDLKTINLIKTFNPDVDVNSLYLPVENVYEQRESAIRKERDVFGKKIDVEYDFIFHYSRLAFKNFKIVSDKSTYYILVDGIVLSIPYDIELTYNFSLHYIMVREFEKQTKYVNNKLKATYINLYMSNEHKVSKHTFKSFFLDYFNNKSFTTKKILSGEYMVSNFACEINYAGHQFTLCAFSDRGHGMVEFNFLEFKFKKTYPISSYSIEKFILDFVNQHEYNCTSIKEAVKHLDDFILVRKMASI